MSQVKTKKIFKSITCLITRILYRTIKGNTVFQQTFILA